MDRKLATSLKRHLLGTIQAHIFTIKLEYLVTFSQTFKFFLSLQEGDPAVNDTTGRRDVNKG